MPKSLEALSLNPFADPRVALAPPIADPDEAECALSRTGAAVRFDWIANPGAFSIDFKVIPVGRTQVVRTTLGTETLQKLNLADRVALIVNATGHEPSIYTTAEVSVAATHNAAPILQPHREIQIKRPSLAPLLILIADAQELMRVSRDTAGTDTGGLEFHSEVAWDSTSGARVHRLLGFVLQELTLEQSAVRHPIVRRRLDDLLLSAFLMLPGKHRRALEATAPHVASGVVRRAEEFMEAHVDQPIGMSEVAAECGCSRTKLFEAFKREREWTPMQFLVQRRMERARRRLLAPTRDLTVTRVALDCGYASFSHFARTYRKLYGEAPSETLGRK